MPDTLPTTQLIVYACPTGPLAEQIEAYYAESLSACGPNRAHDYMPHCTLTGFYRDVPESIPLYIAALEQAFFSAPVGRPSAIITITGMPLLPDWLGLTLIAEEVRERTAHAAHIADSTTRTEAIRLKDNLHVSLAYEFPMAQYEMLKAMAERMVVPTAPVNWDLRLYERQTGNNWVCHYSRPL